MTRLKVLFPHCFFFFLFGGTSDAEQIDLGFKDLDHKDLL